ncbi:hypothetical protein [Paenibacillus shirakamiensis]|nr:hypothetical protein [Paenibacillus shirakamiensis]
MFNHLEDHLTLRVLRQYDKQTALNALTVRRVHREIRKWRVIYQFK